MEVADQEGGEGVVRSSGPWISTVWRAEIREGIEKWQPDQ